MIFSSVEPAVPAAVALRCCIGDILSIRCPADTVAVPLHELGKMLSVLRHGHALVDVDFQIHLPALPLFVGTPSRSTKILAFPRMEMTSFATLTADDERSMSIAVPVLEAMFAEA